MLKILPALLFFLPLFAIAAEDPAEALPEEENDTEFFFRQCYIQVPPIVDDPNTLPVEQQPITIDAQKLYAIPSKLIYEQNVNLTQGDKNLSADKLTYYIEQERVIAEGNVNFNNGQVTLSADLIERQLSTNKTSLYQTDYQFHGQGGRGDADKVYDNGQDLYQLNNSSYSACPPGDNTWSIDSTTLYIDNESGVGSAYNAVLRIKDVPVFYLPYVTYPISDKRKTGLLFPSFEIADTNGLTVKQPLYLNIAENMDATITPTYMQERGTLLAGQYRYLFDVGSGTMQAEYLQDDKIREESRYLYHWNHNASFANNWQFNLDYNRVSDENYFTDISTDYGTRSDNQLLQTANLKYNENNWDSELEVRNFQILGEDDDTPHKVLPKLAFNAYQPLKFRSLQLDWYSEISRFEHSDSDVYTGTRIHLEPKLSLPLYYNSLFVNTELKYMLSFYQQNVSNATKYDDLSETANRYLPSFKIHSGVNFERSFSMADGQYLQTLVPQIQYLYVPYQDQSAIGIYDSTAMQVDYYGLFRDNRFSGYDRIADANQITFGVSSSLINPQGKKKVRLALGQNYYFTPSQTSIPDYDEGDDDEQNTASRSSLIGELDINFENDYFFHAGLALDSDKGEFTSTNFTLEKRWANNTFAQLNYRYYANPEDEEWDIKINQLGTKVNWAINSQWSSFLSYYYDVDYNHSYENIVGFKYQSCCWAVSFSYERYMEAYYGDQDSIKDDYQSEQNFKLNFELTGLGGVGVSSGSESLFDYGRPFYLQ